MSFTRQIENNNKMASTIRQSLGYLPATLLKSIIEEKIYLGKNEKLPIIYSFKTCCMFLDISHFFENISGIPNSEIINIKSKSLYNNVNKNINVPEFYYFFFNRFYEKLISIITNHGGDIIFEGLGIYAIWPPEVSDGDIYKFNKIEESNMINSLYVKAIQCAIDLQKKTFKTDLPNSPSFCPKIGISVGICKFIILKGLDGKYEYATYGDALINSYECSEHSNKKGQIITNSKSFEQISSFYDFTYLEEDNRYVAINSIKNLEPLLQNNKSTVNIIKNNFSLEQIIKKRDILLKFHSYISTDIFQRPTLSEKWCKEINYLTLLYLRFKMTQKDSDDPNKFQEIYLIIQQIVLRLGGNIHKIITDGGGLIFQIAFGTLKSLSSQHEVMAVLAAFEICLKLKKINVFPFIGISTGLSFYGLIGTIGGRREISIISSLIFLGLLCMQKAESMYGDKRYGADDNILIDESTMLMIDSKIPCKFWQKASSRLGIDINLFVPLKIETLINKHTENNLFPLIGTHLHSKDGSEYQLDEEIVKEDDIIYFEEEKLKDMVKLLNNFSNNKTKVKLINITSLTGSGKTLLLKRCLDTFFQMNLKLKEILCNINYGYNYPFIFNGNLLFIMNSEILLNSNNNDYRGIQLILKDIFDIMYTEENGKDKINKLINRNGCQDYVNYIKKLFNFQKQSDKDLEEDEEDSEEQNTHNKTKKSSSKSKGIHSKKDIINASNNNDSLVLTNKIKEKLHLFFLDLIKEYKKFINEIYQETLTLYNISIPIIFIIEDFNTCDKLTKEFIKFYLGHNSNDFLILTANSIPIYPPFVYLDPCEKDPFYEFKDNTTIKKYEVSLYDSEERISRFIQSILFELRRIRISSVSPKILKFLLHKTFGGNPQFIMKLILNIYDQNLLDIKQEKLVETETFSQMLKYNDFTELNIPNIIEKKVGEIINKELDAEEICLLKIAALLGDLFDLTRLKQVIIIDSSSNFVNSLKNGEELCLYKKLVSLESKYIIEILEDLDIKHKFVVCKFSIPFLREILYKRIPSEQRNQLHYIIGKMIKLNFTSKGFKRNKYMSDEMELEMLKKHLKYSEVALHENFLKGNISTNTNENLNINNLKTLIIQQICAKISSIKINDDKNNMIKAGFIYKKSDGKLTWENRYFVLTTNRVVYYYNKEDYKKDEKEPLGIFYLQNLFSVNLLTDGSVGGRKNIFSLSVNEWIKKGSFMTQRIYYLSIEDREELYKWMITFNILKIKAFYDNYCISFGYVNFPLYDRNKNEIIVKPNNVKFNIDKYKEKKNEEKLRINDDSKKKKTSKRMSIFNPYFIIGDKETKMEDIERENSLIHQLLFYSKFIIKYTIGIFFANIQMSFKKTKNEVINRIKFSFSKKIENDVDFATPNYIGALAPDILTNEINILNNNIISRNKRDKDKTLNSIYANTIEYTKQEVNYFSQCYKEIFHPKVNKVNFQILNLKNIANSKTVVRSSYKLFSKDNSKLPTIKEKMEWEEYLEKDNESFKYCDEEKIDNNDFLRYTDYIEKVDNNGSSKDMQRTSVYYRNSIASKINIDTNNYNGYPILGNLMNKAKNLENNGSKLFNIDEFGGMTEEREKNKDSDNDITKNNSKSKKKILKSKNKKKSKKKSKSKEKGKEKDEEKKKEIGKKRDKSKSKHSINITSEIGGLGSNLYSIISEEESNDKEKRKNTNSLRKIKESKENKVENWNDLLSHKSTDKELNNYDLAKEIRKSNLKSPKVVLKSSLNHKKNESISEKSFEGSLYSSVDDKENKDKNNKESLGIDSLNENFSFGGKKLSKKNIAKRKSKIVKENEKEKENDKEIEKEELYSNREEVEIDDINPNNSEENNQDSSVINSSKSVEVSSNPEKNVEKNQDKKEVESFKLEDKKEEEEENKEVLSFKDQSNEFVNKEGKEKESLQSNKNNENIRRNTNSTLNNSRNFNHSIKNNTINNLFDINIFTNNQAQPKSKKEYAYLKELSANQKFIINMKINDKNNNIQQNKNVEIDNNNSEIKSLNSDMFSQIKHLNISLDTEKTYTNFIKKVNKEKSSNYTYKEINNKVSAENKFNSKSKKSTVYSQDKTSGSTNSNFENFYYPDVYYINEEDDLHTKTHISNLFSKLKNRKNN